MPAMRLGLVANTKSGSSDQGSAIERLLRAEGADVETIPLDAFCDGPESVDEDRVAGVARELDADRVVVAGGDGSLGPAALLALTAGRPLGVIPTGTANSFARWVGLPLELDAACRLAADPDATTRPVEVADAAGRPFVNVAATGLSVLAAHHAGPLKRRLGPLAYAAGAARAAFTGRPLRCAVRCDGREAWSGEAWQVFVAATGAFGGESATGGVDPDDHALDVAVVPAGPRVALLRRAIAMRRGRLVHDRGVEHVRGRTLEVHVDGDPAFNVDGELLDVHDPRFSVRGRIDVVHR